MTLVILALAGVAFALWRIQRATPPARRVPVPSTEGATGHNCPGHYYRKAFADMWRCVNCGHLQPVSAEDALDATADEFRGELAHVEAFANGGVTT